MLEKAIRIATLAHNGQLDKAGALYILHSFRVMLDGKTTDEMIVGVLHDVIEDTDVTLEHLSKAGFSLEVVSAIDAITRREGETYSAYLMRIYKNKLARKVKKYDLKDNLNKDRLQYLSDEDKKRMEKYRLALKFMELN